MIYTHREGVSDYIFVIKVFSNDCRVVECRDNMQWIVQRWTGNRWRGERFFRTKAALVKYVCSLGLSVDDLTDVSDNFTSQFGFGQEGAKSLPAGDHCVAAQSDSDHGHSDSTEGL